MKGSTARAIWCIGRLNRYDDRNRFMPTGGVR